MFRLSTLFTLRALQLLVLVSVSAIAGAEWPQIQSTNGFDRGTSIVCDSKGGVYMCGDLQPTGGKNSVAIAKYNKFGVVTYSTVWSDASGHFDLFAGQISVDDAGNAYVTARSKGETGFDISLRKLNKTGVVAWDRTFEGAPGNSDGPIALKVDGQGNVVVLGATAYPDGSSDYLTTKYTKTGVQQWSKLYSSSGAFADTPRALGVDSSNNVIVTGSTWNGSNAYDFGTVKYSSTGVQQWAKKLDANHVDDEAFALAISPDASIVVTGSSLDSGFKNDFLTVKYNENGDVVWQSRTGVAAKHEVPCAIALGTSNDVYVVGTVYNANDTSDVMVAKIAADGAARWSKTYTSQPQTTSPDYGVAVQVDAAENVYVGASLKKNFVGEGVAMAVVKYTSTGTFVDDKRYRITADSPAVMLAMTYDPTIDNVYLTGYAYNAGTSSYDIYTSKY